MKDYLRDNSITMYSDCAIICNEMKLSLGERAVYNLIYTYCKKGKDKECRQPLTFFQQWTGLSRPGVSKILKSLEEMKLIERTPYLNDDSDVVRMKCTLVEQERKSRVEMKAEVAARTKMIIDDFNSRKATKALAAQGLLPVPKEQEGLGWIGLKIDSAGNKYLIPDGVKQKMQERYYTKEEYERIFSDRYNVDDINF